MFTNIINADDLHAHLEASDWVIIDCRHSLADTEEGRRSYHNSHIPGAIYAHLDEDLSGPIIAGKTGRHPLPDIDTFSARLSSWGIEEGVQVVVYDDKGGAIAARLWWMLHWLGHKSAAVLNGGWQFWVNQAYPVDNLIPKSNGRIFKPSLNEEMVVNADDVKSIQHDLIFSLVDSRAAPRYRGEVEPIDPVAGHIDGAINLPFPENLDEDMTLKSPDWLWDRFEKATGGKPGDLVVFYCGSGVTACHNILAFDYAGFGMAKLYPGSWSEWITQM
ncbi:MAG: sulfurtransferase [Bacteroidetes bacterium]|nr:MAG: sulfurtransferase [Bacteroidota bacterium]